MSEKILKEILNEIKDIKNRQNEMYQVLRALEDKTDTHSAKLNKINHDVAEVKGNTRVLEREETKKFLKTGSKIVSLLSE